ncbi:MAG: TRAP transporter small permease [Hyphomicrobiales bacterium]
MLVALGQGITLVLHRVLGVALLLVVAINVANASGRYLFGYSLTGTDELMVYTMVWVVMAGAVFSLAGRTHIGVDLLPTYARGRLRHLVFLVHDIAALVACGYATWASWQFVMRISGLGTTSMGLGIPMAIPHAALLAGFACLALVAGVLFLRGLVALVRNDPDAERPA